MFFPRTLGPRATPHCSRHLGGWGWSRVGFGGTGHRHHGFDFLQVEGSRHLGMVVTDHHQWTPIPKLHRIEAVGGAVGVRIAGFVLIAHITAFLHKAIGAKAVGDVQQNLIVRRLGIADRMAAVAGHELTLASGGVRIESPLSKTRDASAVFKAKGSRFAGKDGLFDSRSPATPKRVRLWR